MYYSDGFTMLSNRSSSDNNNNNSSNNNIATGRLTFSPTSPTSSKQAAESQRAANEGCLEATVLSVYDLPTVDQPKAVTLQVGDVTASTGPPVAKHKDRNSFRFNAAAAAAAAAAASAASTESDRTNGSSDSHILTIRKSFPELYRSEAVFRLVYPDPKLDLQATLQLSDLRIHHTSWHILTFEPASAPQRQTTTEWSEDGPPTVRVKLYLDGPYRPEIGAILGVAEAWFGVVDRIEDRFRSTTRSVPNLPRPDVRYILVPAVPVLLAVLVASPAIAGILLVGMPFFLPLLITLLFLVACTVLTTTMFYASTRHGRENVGGTVAPFVDSLLASKAGQDLVYNTGERPTPVGFARYVLPDDMWPKLGASVGIDLIGASTYLLPIVGELLDLFWAPVAFILVMAMYDKQSPTLKYVSLVEEILPFTDLVPTATIGWFIEFSPELFGNRRSGNGER